MAKSPLLERSVEAWDHFTLLPLSQVDRKQVPADWNRKLQALQAKTAEALKELPPGFLGQFEGAAGGAPVHVHARRQQGLRGGNWRKMGPALIALRAGAPKTQSSKGLAPAG